VDLTHPGTGQIGLEGRTTLPGTPAEEQHSPFTGLEAPVRYACRGLRPSGETLRSRSPRAHGRPIERCLHRPAERCCRLVGDTPGQAARRPSTAAGAPSTGSSRRSGR
jgi:hypothetical protein